MTQSIFDAVDKLELTYFCEAKDFYTIRPKYTPRHGIYLWQEGFSFYHPSYGTCYTRFNHSSLPHFIVAFTFTRLRGRILNLGNAYSFGVTRRLVDNAVLGMLA